jgi:hypothetical protein
MANRKKIILLAILFLAAVAMKASAQTTRTEGNISHVYKKPRVTKTGINIFLLADENIDSITAVEMPLSELVLRDEPWITSEDIELYDFSSHCIYFKEEAPPLPVISVSLKGNPFVVTADGQRCYLGSLWAPGSSFSPVPNIPLIDTINFTLPRDIIRIYYKSFVSSSEENRQMQDVRNDPRIMQVLIRDEQYHVGLEIRLENVELANKNGGSSLTYTYTMKNKDEDDLYVFDPNKMGAGLFHYYNNCPYIIPQDSEQSITADTSKIVKQPETSEKIETSWFSLIKSGELMTRTVILDAYPEINPGKYKCVFWFNSPGLQFSKDQRDQFDSRVWMGRIEAESDFKVNTRETEAEK